MTVKIIDGAATASEFAAKYNDPVTRRTLRTKKAWLLSSQASRVVGCDVMVVYRTGIASPIVSGSRPFCGSNGASLVSSIM